MPEPISCYFYDGQASAKVRFVYPYDVISDASPKIRYWFPSLKNRLLAPLQWQSSVESALTEQDSSTVPS